MLLRTLYYSADAGDSLNAKKKKSLIKENNIYNFLLLSELLYFIENISFTEQSLLTIQIRGSE